MRCILAIALVLHLSGVPAAWAKPCAMAAARGEHACCVMRQAARGLHLTGSCGCRMDAAPSGPLPSAATVAPDPGWGQDAPGLVAVASPFSHAVVSLPNQCAGPPGPVNGASLTLQASGFRC